MFYLLFERSHFLLKGVRIQVLQKRFQPRTCCDAQGNQNTEQLFNFSFLSFQAIVMSKIVEITNTRNEFPSAFAASVCIGNC